MYNKAMNKIRVSTTFPFLKLVIRPCRLFFFFCGLFSIPFISVRFTAIFDPNLHF